MSFRREKFIPKGGPDGGDGGKGGDVICLADAQLQTLLDFRYKKKFKAQNGRSGQGANKFGKSGQDVIIRVPVGTVITNTETNEVIGDLTEDGQEVIVAHGGKGGRGNARFATPTNQAPRKYEIGKPGEALSILLELKLLADIGLVGLPNAGKSTLLSRISAARPKIADYPFTTLTPNLGIANFRDRYSFVVADIPGLIEGAHDGKGLGVQFLRHIERTRVLAFLVESITDNIGQHIELLRRELKSYNPFLLQKPWFVVLTKMDLVSDPANLPVQEIEAKGIDVCRISSVTGQGIDEVLHIMWKYVSAEQQTANQLEL